MQIFLQCRWIVTAVQIYLGYIINENSRNTILEEGPSRPISLLEDQLVFNEQNVPDFR